MPTTKKNGNHIHPRSIHLNMAAFNLTAISSYPQALLPSARSPPLITEPLTGPVYLTQLICSRHKA
jgi:hypothetical protein